ncbi:MAG: hypothetical protein ACREAB_07255 [Blastocatellia bacterium]
MKARLIKKGEQWPGSKPTQKPITKLARRGGPGVDPRIAFAALFAAPGGERKAR